MTIKDYFYLYYLGPKNAVNLSIIDSIQFYL